jgi:glycosyltransferase involved in cell wall biosynthesis
MVMKPKISFVAPVWNKVAYLADTIRSLQAQTLEDIEILFIDDGSTDATREIIRWFAKDDKRIKVFGLKKNYGLGVAWNIGHKIASSDIIAVASGDDIWVPERAQLAYDFFHNNPSKDVHYGSFYFCDYKMDKTEYKPALPYSKKRLLTPRADGFSTQYIGHFVMAYRKRITRAVKMDESRKYGIDYPFILELAKRGYKFGWTSKVLGYARCLNTGVSQMHRQEILAQDHKLEGR